MTLQARFGFFLDPIVTNPQEPFRLAQIADDNGLDLLTIQDHPYQPRFYENWTLLTALAMRTRQIHFSPSVANLPLRLPVMLAKQAATLDILSEGRVELGIGAGVFWDAIEAYGGTKRSPAEAYQAFEDSLHILRAFWDKAGQVISYEGKIHRVKALQAGPAPAHRIPIWVGGRGPKMLRLTGRMGDGLLISMAYNPPDVLPEINALIDEGAKEANRSPEAIRRGYNLSGYIRSGSATTGTITPNNMIDGTAGYWIEQILRLYYEYRQDTFIFWAGGNTSQQLEIFSQEIVPVVKDSLKILA